jgi:hypothetical protein
MTRCPTTSRTNTQTRHRAQHALLALLLAAAGLAGAAPTLAQSLIARQQAAMRALQPQWTAAVVPHGMQTGPMRAPTLRDSGASGLSLSTRNVDFHLTGDIGFHVVELAATLGFRASGCRPNWAVASR